MINFSNAHFELRSNGVRIPKALSTLKEELWRNVNKFLDVIINPIQIINFSKRLFLEFSIFLGKLERSNHGVWLFLFWGVLSDLEYIFLPIVRISMAYFTLREIEMDKFVLIVWISKARSPRSSLEEIDIVTLVS